jgi:predicted phage terminase large subunit-like protein
MNSVPIIPLRTLDQYSILEAYLATLPPGEQQQAFHDLCLSDLYFLLRYVLNRPDAQKQWILDRCREVQSEPDDRLDLWSRGHYKSSIITFALTIQDVLRDPEITVGIFSHTRPIAKGFLRQIKREFEQNANLKGLFPTILWDDPGKQAPKWSEDDGLTVQRLGNPKESTVEAHGLVDGQPTGKHYRLVVYDDVVTQSSVTSPEMMTKTTEALELSYNLGSEGGRRRFIGTRYHQSDSYRTILDRGTAILRKRLATSDGTLDGEPAIWTRETLRLKRADLGPYTFACQIMQDPLHDATQGFRREWLRFYDNRSGQGMNKLMLVDAANSKRKSSDYTTIWIIGLAADRNMYALDIIRDRLNLTERAAAVMRLHRKWRPMQVRYEAYGLMADVAHIKSVQEAENYRFDITEVAGKTPKNDRIRRLIPVMEQGRFYLPHTLNYADYEGVIRDLVHDFIETEYVAFPVAAHDDMMDSLARIEEPELDLVWPRESTADKKDRYAVKHRTSAWAA